MIHKLSTEVINKIAAGEVVQRPYNALKELIQNSIDAGATIIHIKIQEGGMRKLQIKDNGKGVSLQDFPLLCERYATSKIKNVTDLQSISSFGFRGEALASLTHVGDVEVTSRYQKCQHGYKAKFDKQKLLSDPVSVKRQIGTTITVQNLFLTLASRRKSLAPNQQKKLIKQLIYQVALDYPHIEFVLTTQKGDQILIDYKNISQDQARLKIFCQLTGCLKQYLLQQRLTISQSSKTQILSIMSKINTYNKYRQIIVSINHRLIDCPELEKIIEKAYDQANRTIHKQNYSYCCYLNIKIDSNKIDCNVHPTKKQINFYKSGDMFFQILKWMEKLLEDSGTIKYLDTHARITQQSLLELQQKFKGCREREKVGLSRESLGIGINKEENSQSHSNSQSQSQRPAESMIKYQKPLYDNNRTRTDAKQLPLQYFYKNLVIQQQNSNQVDSSSQNQKNGSNNNQMTQRFIYQHFADYYKGNGLSQEIVEIKNFFLAITYVGCFNSSHIFIQIQNKLYCFAFQYFAKAYIREVLKQKRHLYIKKVKQDQSIQISSIIKRFLNNNSQIGMIDNQKRKRIYGTTLDQLILNRDVLESKFGIKVNEFLEIESYPIIDIAFTNQPLREQPLAYLLVQVFGSKQLQYRQEDHNKLYIEFLANSFYSIDSDDNQNNKFQLSPFTDMYDNFFSNQFIPKLKLKGKFYKEEFQGVQILDLISEMMDLKDAYKMFERC